MPETISSVCEEYSKKFIRVQDIWVSILLKDFKKAVDPKGTMKLNPEQVMSTKAFLRVLEETASSRTLLA